MSAARTILRGALLLDADREKGWRGPVDLVVAGARIEALAEPGATPAGGADTVIDASGRLAAPGLVNAHTHSQSSAMAGFGDRLSHPAFMWLTQAHTSRRTRDEIRLAVLLTAWGMLATGTTAAIDHFPGQRFGPDDLDAVMAAWEETGLRVALGMRFFDAAFSDIIPASLPQDLRARLADVELLKPQPLDSLRDLFGHGFAAWHGRRGRLAVFPAPSNPDRCTDAALMLCAEMAEAHDAGVHTHLLETRRQAEIALARHGGGPVAHLDALGVLSARWSCAHSIWLQEREIALMARHGAIAVLNPESYARLGTGLAPIPALRREGVRLELGTDGAGSNDNLAMHEAMRAIATAHRAEEPDRSRWMGAREALAVATTGGAATLRGPAGLGTLAPGAPADLALYRLDAPWWTPLNDAVAQFVFAETGAAVDLVMVDGAILLRDGRPTRFDPGELSREVAAMTARLRGRNADLFAAARAVAAIA